MSPSRTAVRLGLNLFIGFKLRIFIKEFAAKEKLEIVRFAAKPLIFARGLPRRRRRRNASELF
jgi:hypothetical protein